MRNFFFLLLTVPFVFLACSQGGDFAETALEKSSSLDGEYQGTLIIERQHSINNYPYGWADTFELQFLIELSNFKHGSCPGNVTVQSDTISFDGTDCGCWCDCSPYVDCGGDLLLGTKQFSFDGDSLLMWAAGGSIDSFSFPGYYLGYHQSAFYRLKKL